jgi:hypothetical protein
MLDNDDDSWGNVPFDDQDHDANLDAGGNNEAGANRDINGIADDDAAAGPAGPCGTEAGAKGNIDGDAAVNQVQPGKGQLAKSSSSITRAAGDFDYERAKENGLSVEEISNMVSEFAEQGYASGDSSGSEDHSRTTSPSFQKLKTFFSRPKKRNTKEQLLQILDKDSDGKDAPRGGRGMERGGRDDKGDDIRGSNSYSHS